MDRIKCSKRQPLLHLHQEWEWNFLGYPFNVWACGAVWGKMSYAQFKDFLLLPDQMNLGPTLKKYFRPQFTLEWTWSFLIVYLKLCDGFEPSTLGRVNNIRFTVTGKCGLICRKLGLNQLLYTDEYKINKLESYPDFERKMLKSGARKWVLQSSFSKAWMRLFEWNWNGFP